MKKSIIKYVYYKLAYIIVYLKNLNKIIKIQRLINNKIENSYHVISLVMCNAGQQQFFEDIVKYSNKSGNNFYFILVNDSKTQEEEIIEYFKGFDFITHNEYIHLRRIDIALHTEIHCRSPQVKNRCFIGHGFPGKHTVWSEENLMSFNHYFLYGPRDRKIIKYVTRSNESLTNHIKFWEVGYPKYDSQINKSENDNSLASSLGIDNTKKTVLFAPAWDHGGVLRTYGIDILAEFSKLRDYNVIIKLHPASLVKKNSKHFNFYTGGIEWQQTMVEFSRKNNIIYYQHQKINPLFQIADVLITDFSGVALGFFIEDKPVVVIDCPEYYNEVLPSLGEDGNIPKYNDLFNNGRRASYIISEICKIGDAVCHVLSNPDESQDERHELAAQLLYNPGKGTASTVDTINKILTNK